MKSACIVQGCERPQYGLGLCNPHYQQFRLYGKITRLHIGQRPKRATCSVEGCAALVVSRGLCNMHTIRMRRHGSPDVNYGWGAAYWVRKRELEAA